MSTVAQSFEASPTAQGGVFSAKTGVETGEDGRTLANEERFRGFLQHRRPMKLVELLGTVLPARLEEDLLAAWSERKRERKSARGESAPQYRAASDDFPMAFRLIRMY